MRDKKANHIQSNLFNVDSQKRLLAYTTAAGLGAFALPSDVDAQVSQSSALAPYPNLLLPGSGTGVYGTYFYLDIDGDSTADFNLGVSNWRVDITPTAAGGHILNPLSNAYIIPWTAGLTIDGGGSNPTYQRWLATPNFNNFTSSGAMGFEFISGLDGQTHFGYIDLQIDGVATGIGQGNLTATVNGIFWEETPNTGIPVQAVPEPSSLALLAVGAAGLALRRMRRV